MGEELESCHLNSALEAVKLISCIKKETSDIVGKKSRSVSFPKDESELITGFLEPANPWEYAENFTRDDLISSYEMSCDKNGVSPLESVMKQLKEVDLSAVRSECFSLKGEVLGIGQCESLEEVLKRLQFKDINLEETSLEDESAVALFDMIEYYEFATHLNISSNKNIGVRGWQACARLLKKTTSLIELNARNVTLNEQHMPFLCRALKLSTQLQVLKLENCNLAGRSLLMLAAALKVNSGLRELYLADNNLCATDAVQIGSLLRSNSTLQLLDVSNNYIQDAGVGHICDGLIEQCNEGLNVLVLWNNQLTRHSSTHFARAMARCNTLEMLNMGQNMLTNECAHVIKDALLQNKTLLRLGMQSTHLTCDGAIAIAECITEHSVLQRIDLRDNNLKLSGLTALCQSMKNNSSVTQLDLDDVPKKKGEGEDILEKYKSLVSEIRSYCSRNLEWERELEDTVDECDEAVTRRPRLTSVNTRKISLTCETLLHHNKEAEELGQNVQQLLLTEPRRSGGRLRSPEPSPVPSPASSPVPGSPRNRFHVSRVAEGGSLNIPSNNSSPLSSPAVSPSMSSSPVRFFPSPTASRFKVTIIEPSSSGASETNKNSTTPDISQNSQEPVSPMRKDISAGENVAVPNVIISVSTSVNTPTVNPLAVDNNSRTVTSDGDEQHEDCETNGRTTPNSDAADLEVRQILNDSTLTWNDKSDDNVPRNTDVFHSSPCLEEPKPSENNSEAPLFIDTVDGDKSVKNKNKQKIAENESRPLSDSNIFRYTIPPSQRSRKIGWTPLESQNDEQKLPSSLNKLLNLFHHPGSLFSKSQSSQGSIAPANSVSVTSSSLSQTTYTLLSNSKNCAQNNYLNSQNNVGHQISTACKKSSVCEGPSDSFNNNDDCDGSGNKCTRDVTGASGDENLNTKPSSENSILDSVTQSLPEIRDAAGPHCDSKHLIQNSANCLDCHEVSENVKVTQREGSENNHSILGFTVPQNNLVTEKVNEDGMDMAVVSCSDSDLEDRFQDTSDTSYETGHPDSMLIDVPQEEIGVNCEYPFSLQSVMVEQPVNLLKE